MTEEEKIKSLLDSPNSESQLLGCQLAKSVLGWDDEKILDYFLTNLDGWNPVGERFLHKELVMEYCHQKHFLGTKIKRYLKQYGLAIEMTFSKTALKEIRKSLTNDTTTSR